MASKVMQRRKRPQGKIASNDFYFSGDEFELGNDRKAKNSVALNHIRDDSYWISRKNSLELIERSTHNIPSHCSSTKETNKRISLSKKNQTAETLKWLSENYELIQGVCVPRCVLYTHYLDFCKKRKYSPAGPATFGKLIRQRFPNLTTRRLGTRGQSKYHYYGISIKKSSVYHYSVYTGKGFTRFSGPNQEKSMTKKSFLDKKARNSLPVFPNANEMVLDENLSVEKIETFVMMYRTHCQRLLDTVMNAKFSEVHRFLLHFWQGMPNHMIPVLECNAIVDIIIVCDSLLYKIFNDILVPTCIQDIPESLTEEIQSFAVTFVKSLETCLVNTPALLRNRKFRVAKNFVRLLKRNMTFINLAQIARPVFLSYESMSEILNEFHSLDLKKILSEWLFLTEDKNVQLPVLLMFLQEFETLLVKQAPIEGYAEWLDNIVEEYVLKKEETLKNPSESLFNRSEKFMTSWSFITSRILQELTLKGANMFGSFQLIIMMFEEYIFLIIETKVIAQFDEDLKLGLRRHLKDPDFKEGKITRENFTRQGQTQGLHQNESQWNQKEYEATKSSLGSQNFTHNEKEVFENIRRQNEEFQSQQNNSQFSGNLQKHPFYSQPTALPQTQIQNQESPTPISRGSLNSEEVYLGINAVPNEICRIENTRSNPLVFYHQDECANAQYYGRNLIQNNAYNASSHGQVYGKRDCEQRHDFNYNDQGQTHESQMSIDVGQNNYLSNFSESSFPCQDGYQVHLTEFHHQRSINQDYRPQIQINAFNTLNAVGQNIAHSHAENYSCSHYIDTISDDKNTHLVHHNHHNTQASYQEKTALPSFIQLSSQLSNISRLSTGC